MELFRREALNGRSNQQLAGALIVRSIPTWGVIALLTAVLSTGIVGTAIIPYPQIVSASGTVVSDRPPLRIGASALGRVTRIFVRDGEFVVAGQPLVELSTSPNLAEGTTERGVAERHLAILDDLSRLQVQASPVRLQRATERVLASKLRLKSLADQRDQQRTIIRSLAGIVDSIKPEVEKGFISRLTFEQKLQSLAEARQAMARLDADQASAEDGLAEARDEVAKLRSDSAATRMELLARKQQVLGDVAALKAAQSHRILAPASGYVSDVQIGTGEEAIPGTILMIVSPKGRGIAVETILPPGAVGQVRIGARVELEYSAYGRTGTARAAGRVTWISPAVLSQTELRGAAPSSGGFRVRIAPQLGDGMSIPALLPNMLVKVSIAIGRASLLRRLTTPLTSNGVEG